MSEQRGPAIDITRIPNPLGSAATEVAAIHKLRLQQCRKGKWPAHSIATWTAIAARADARPTGVSPSPLEQRALEVVAAAKEGARHRA